MDFLDPQAKRRHRIRLAIGYGLVATLIATATAILVYRAYGFDVDRKTGEVYQNGLVYVDSAPDNADVFVNGDLHKDRTNTRMALPAGGYNIKLQKKGYRNWERGIELEGGSVERLTYPLLVPSELERSELKTFEAKPGFAAQSPDRRWAIISVGNSLTNFIEYDFNSLTNERPAERKISFAASLFRVAPGAHSLELVEWSNDNKHLLIRHNFGGGHEFIVLNRDKPETSFNINQLTGQSPAQLTLIDKKFDQWHLYHQQGGVLQSASVKAPAPQAIAANVSSYKSHGEDVLLYAQNIDPKLQRVILRQGQKSYNLRDIKPGSVQLEIARYDGDWFVVVGLAAENKVLIYKNPQDDFSDDSKPVPKSALRVPGELTNIKFSQNTRFVSAQSGQHFEIFDVEFSDVFRFDVDQKFDDPKKVVWMDGHRLLGGSEKKITMFDFDGSNRQTLVPSVAGLPVFFDRDFTALYTVDQQTISPAKFGFYSTALRLEADK